MARAARIYDFTLTAGGTFTLLVEGSYYRLLASTGAIEVRREDGSVVGPIQAGQGEQNQEFKRLTLVDKSGSNNIGTIVVADNTFVDTRTTGEVSVIDGGKARSLAGNAFSGYAGSNILAANNSHTQLWNPTTTKNIILEQLIVTVSGISGVFLRASTVACTTLGSNAENKKLGGAATVMQLRNQQNATPLGVGNLAALTISANTPFLYSPKEPIVIPPNSGLIVLASTQAVGIDSVFEYFEESV